MYKFIITDNYVYIPPLGTGGSCPWVGGKVGREGRIGGIVEAISSYTSSCPSSKSSFTLVCVRGERERKYVYTHVHVNRLVGVLI